MITVDRCLCERKSFASLLAIAKAHALDFEALRQREGCGARCGLCAPYLRRALVTGETVFHELILPDSERR